MSRWTVDLGDHQVVVSTSQPGQPPKITFRLRDRDGNPVDQVHADPEAAQDLRMKIGAAIGTVSFPASDEPAPVDPVEAVGGTWLDDTDHTTHGWRPDHELQRSLCGRVANRDDLTEPEDQHGRDPACLLAAALELGSDLVGQQSPEDAAEYQRGN